MGLQNPSAGVANRPIEHKLCEKVASSLAFFVQPNAMKKQKKSSKLLKLIMGMNFMRKYFYWRRPSCFVNAGVKTVLMGYT